MSRTKLDSAVCTNCRFGCSIARPKALSLLDAQPTEFVHLMSDAQTPWRDLVKMAHWEGYYYPTWFTSSKLPLPCLFRMLDGALTLACHIATRRGNIEPQGLQSWLAPLRDSIAVRGIAATTYAADIEWFGSTPSTVNVAMAYWVEAACAYDDHDVHLCIGALMHCHLMLGIVFGPLHQHEVNSNFAKAKGRKFNYLRDEALGYLLRLSDEVASGEREKFAHVSIARTEVVEHLLDFRTRLEEPRRGALPADMEQYLKELAKDDPALSDAFKQVSARTEGRPPGKRHKPIAQKKDSSPI